MKNTIFLTVAALFLSAAVHAQSTVDSIEAKYKLVPMPGPLTIEQTFPAIGSYQLNGTTTGNLTITLDSNNKGMVWVEGLPQGRVKAYLKQSPATYRILPQKTESGEHVPEGTLVYDSSSHVINIALGAPYNESDPTAIFALNPNSNLTANAGMNMAADSANTSVNANDETKIKTEDGTKVKTEAKGNNTVKVKTKTPAAKSKAKVTFYTGTKIEMNTTDQNMQQEQAPAATDQQPQAQPQQDQQPQTQPQQNSQPQSQPQQNPQPQNQQQQDQQ